MRRETRRDMSRLRTCPSKVKYGSKQEAKLIARRLKNGRLLSAYQCPGCQHWHIGHRRDAKDKDRFLN